MHTLIYIGHNLFFSRTETMEIVPLVWLACPTARASSAVVRAKLSAFMDEFRGEMQSMEE